MLLFLLYTAELFEIIAHFGFVSHSYADDTLVYVSALATSALTIAQHFILSVEQVNALKSSNKHKMNTDKTQLIWFGTKQQQL